MVCLISPPLLPALTGIMIAYALLGGMTALSLLMGLRSKKPAMTYAETRVSNLHIFIPIDGKEVTFYAGTTEVTHDGNGVITTRCLYHEQWDPLVNGGDHWWIPFTPYITVSKQLETHFYCYAEGKRWMIISYTSCQPVCREVMADWSTATGFYKPESTWWWVKA